MTLPSRNSVRVTFLMGTLLRPRDTVGGGATMRKDLVAEEVSVANSILAAPPKL